MPGQAWFRNPLTYINECVEQCAPNYAWDRGYARKMRIDPQRHLEMRLASAVQYRILMMGDQGTAELRRGHTLENPYAVYPTWEYGTNSFDELEEMLATPSGDAPHVDSRRHLPADERPVLGQEHRVVVTRYPSGSTKIGQGFLKALAKLQSEYPEVIVHLHGTYSMRHAFGMGFGAADIDPRHEAAQGKLLLPNGKKINYLQAGAWNQWVTLLGFTIGDLSVPRNRCMFNIKSAMWAADNWDETVAFRTKNGALADPYELKPKPVEVKRTYTGKTSPGDKFACNACSVAPTCKYFRDGGVCAIPETEASELARLFGTRSSDLIIEGLGALQQVMVTRAEEGRQLENIEGKMIPEVTKMLNAAFQNGVKLAKLVDPKLAAAGAPKVIIGTLSQGQGGGMTANELVAVIVGELQQSGVDRADITNEMIGERIAAMSRPRGAIEAHSRE